MTNTNQTIEERLKERFSSMLHYIEAHTGESERENLKSFINSELEKQKDGLREMIEKMQKKCEWCKKIIDIDCQHYDEKYNQALSDILNNPLLREEIK